MSAGVRPRIVVLDDWERGLKRLVDWATIEAHADVTLHHSPLHGAALLEAIESAHVLVLLRDRTALDAALVAQLPHLQYVMFTGTRNTRLDVQALQARGIPVSHTGWGPSKDSTCEMTWALILAATRDLQAHSTRLHAGGWRDPSGGVLPSVLAGQRLGLIGLGEIGGRVARVGRGFGMEVVTWSPRMTTERAAEQGAAFVPLEELLATSRVVSLHLVPTPPTRHLLNAERLALMRPDSLLVNTSRPALVDTNALAAALGKGHPAAAAIDVFDAEPLPVDDPLRTAPRALLTPHLGFVSELVYQRFATDITECLLAWLQQKQPLPRQLPSA